MLREVPPTLLDLMKVLTGFYGAVAFIAIYCNWLTPYRIPVIAVLLLGLLALLLAEVLFACFVVVMARRRRRPGG